MWASILLYIVAGALLVYVIWSILRARRATSDQALALLGVVVKERGQYWTVGCSGGTCGLQLRDSSGKQVATYSLPEDIQRLEWIAWDGNYLLGSEGQTIYKLEPSGAEAVLSLVDSYAPVVHSLPNQPVTGLTWDGEHLWVLAQNALARLDKGGRPTCTLQVYEGPHWWGYEGLAWDGSWLWVAYPEANTVYRIDPAGCD